MQQGWKALAMGVALATALSAPSVFAAQNVANTSQKGSLLIFPQIDVRPDRNTVIRIANDANRGIDLKCYYVNERKGRVDFQVRLTKKQPVVWEALSGYGDPYNVNSFPVYEDELVAGTLPLWSTRVGELICFAVDEGGEAQVSWNHLSGTATVYDYSAGTSYEYSAWSFTARNGVAGEVHGTPGRLELTGAATGRVYDACPAYNIVNFAPVGTEDHVGLHHDVEIAVSSCSQDLTQDFLFHFTKIQIPVWNAQEVRFTGTYVCIDSTAHFPLSTLYGKDLSNAADNTSYSKLRTEAAHLQLNGVRSTECPFVTEPAGLVAVAVSHTSLHDSTGEGGGESAAGTTAFGAGASAVPGFVLFDISGPPPEKR
jgi:hypothetical protein